MNFMKGYASRTVLIYNLRYGKRLVRRVTYRD